MFLRSQRRWKNGKQHRYFSVVENRRVTVASPKAGKVAQRTVLYLSEINDSQQAAWRKTLEVFDESSQQTHQLSLFPEDRPLPPDALNAIQVKLSEMQLCRPRAYGNCWPTAATATACWSGSRCSNMRRGERPSWWRSRCRQRGGPSTVRHSAMD